LAPAKKSERLARVFGPDLDDRHAGTIAATHDGLGSRPKSGSPDRLPRAIFHRDAHGSGRHGEEDYEEDRRDPERRVAFNDRVPSCFEGEELPNVTNRRLRSVLKIAMARCPLHDLCPAPFAELSTWFCPKEAEGKWASFERSFGETETVAKFSTSLASALKLVGRLLESDLAQAKASSGKRAPVGVEREVLRVLLSSPTALDGRAIADKIGSRRSPLSEKTVWDAVARLRAECGFKIDKTGAGYKLDDRDRALAREFGISVEAVEVES
jgi:biotin operon repressor